VPHPLILNKIPTYNSDQTFLVIFECELTKVWSWVGLKKDPESGLDVLTVGNHLSVKLEQDEALKESYEERYELD